MISRDEILKVIIDSLKKQFNIQIDFDNPNLETWLAQTLSVLDENQLMYLTLLMNESFLTTALLPSTIKKFATDYGYAYKNVQPAHGDLDIFIGFDQTTNIDIEIDYETEFTTADGIIYTPERKIYLTYSKETNIANIVAYDITGNKFVVPYSYEVISTTKGPINAIHFKLPVIQAVRKNYSFVVSAEDVVNYKFPTFTIPYPTDAQISTFNVYVSGVPAYRKSFLFELDPDHYSYIVTESPDGYQIIFGNSLIGKGLSPGDIVVVETLESLGSKGNVYANSLSLKTPIINKVTGSPVHVLIQHSDIQNGKDAETPNEIRLNTINQLHLNDRLVTEKDFEILAESNVLPFEDVFVIFTESDLYVNEVCIFGFFTENGNLIKSITGTFETTEVRIPQFTKLYLHDKETNHLSLTQQDATDYEYVLPFEIVINTDTLVALCYYYPTNYDIPFKIIQESYYELDHQSYAKITSLKQTYENQKALIELNIDLHVQEFDSVEDNLKFSIQFNQQTYSTEITDIYTYNYDSETNQLTIYFEIPEDAKDEVTTLSVLFYYKYTLETEYSLLSYIESNPFRVKYNITSYTPVKLRYDNEKYILYGVPAVEDNDTVKSYLPSLYLDAIEYIEDRKMLTNKVAIAFGKTYGLLSTAHLTESQLNEIQDGEIYIPVKLKIKLQVSTLMSKQEIIDQVVQYFKDTYKPRFRQSVIRSKLIQDLRNTFDYIRDIEIYIVDKDGNSLDKDLDIYYTAQDIPKDEILTFVPDVISLDIPDIEVVFI